MSIIYRSKTIHSFVGILKDWESQNIDNFEKFRFWNGIFSITTKCTSSTKAVIENFQRFGQSSLKKFLNSVPALEFWLIKMLQGFVRHSFSNSFCSKTTDLVSSCKCPTKIFLCLLNFFWRWLFNYHAVELWWTRNFRKCYWSWHSTLFKSMILQSDLPNFPIKLPVDSFLLEVYYVFWENWVFFSKFKCESLMAKNNKSVKSIDPSFSKTMALNSPLKVCNDCKL